MPQGQGDPDLTAEDLRGYFHVEGDFAPGPAAEPLGRGGAAADVAVAAPGVPRPRARRCRPSLFANPGDARHRPALAAPLRHRSLSALARRSAADPAFGPAHGPRPQMRRPHHPFRTCGRRLSPGWASIPRGSSSPITAPSRAATGRRSARRRRGRGSICPRIGRSPSMPGGSTLRRGSTKSSLSPISGRTTCSFWSARKARARSRPLRRRAPMSASSPGRRRRLCPPGCGRRTSC